MPRRKKSFGPKDPFAEIPTEWKDAVAGSTPDEINTRIATVTKETEALLKARDEDQDYQTKKEALKEAGAVYRDGKKTNRLKVLYCIRCLSDKGKV